MEDTIEYRITRNRLLPDNVFLTRLSLYCNHIRCGASPDIRTFNNFTLLLKLDNVMRYSFE